MNITQTKSFNTPFDVDILIFQKKFMLMFQVFKLSNYVKIL